MPRTLITGGFGFLGTWLAAALRRCGHEVFLVDNRPVTGSPLFLSGLLTDSGVRIGRADVTVPDALDRFGAFQYVIHAAAVFDAPQVPVPRSTIMGNTLGTEMTLRFAARQPDLRRFVLFSTGEVYGDPGERSVAEDGWLSVRVDHAAWSAAISKAVAEAITVAYADEFDIPYVTVRPFDVYGPLRTGPYPISALAGSAFAGEPLTVSGDGEQVRSWCHVEDFVNGVLRCMHSPDSAGQAVNIGDDREPLTATALSRQIREVADSRSEIRYVANGVPEVRHRRPDLTKARRLFGYEPVWSLADGLRETVTWLRCAAHPYPISLIRRDWPTWE